MDKYRLRMEKTTANAVYRALQKEKKMIQEYLRSYDTKKSFESDLEAWMISIGIGKIVVDAFIANVERTITRSAREAYNRTKKDYPDIQYSVDFSIPNRKESVYLEALKDVHLSQRMGSISATTEERVKKLVTRGMTEGMTYKEVADEIEKLDPQVFSRNRAELIAINQIGKATEVGNSLQYDELWKE